MSFPGWPFYRGFRSSTHGPPGRIAPASMLERKAGLPPAPPAMTTLYSASVAGVLKLHYSRINGAVGGLRSPDTIITNDLLFRAELQQRNTPAGANRRALLNCVPDSTAAVDVPTRSRARPLGKIEGKTEAWRKKKSFVPRYSILQDTSLAM